MLEKNQSIEFKLDYDGNSNVLKLGEAIEDTTSIYKTGYSAYPGTVNGVEAIQIFSFKNEKWYIHFISEDIVYEIVGFSYNTEASS